MRCTGSSGQTVEHQPLLPLSTIPPANAPAIAPSSSSALSGPVSSSPTLRRITKPMNPLMAMT